MAYQLPDFQFPYYTNTLLVGVGGIQVSMALCSVCHAVMQASATSAHTQWHQKQHNDTSAMLTGIYADFQALTDVLTTAESEISSLRHQIKAKGAPTRRRRGTPAGGHTAAKNDRLHNRRMGTLADPGGAYIESPASGRHLTVYFDCPKCQARIDRRDPNHFCSIVEVANKYCMECEQPLPGMSTYQYVYGTGALDPMRVFWSGHKECVLPLTSPCDSYVPRQWNGTASDNCETCGWQEANHVQA